MLANHEFTVGCEVLEGLSLEDQIITVVEIAVDEGALEDEETAAADETLGERLFGKPSDPVASYGKLAEPIHRPGHRLRAEAPMGAVKCKQRTHVDVAQPVAICEAEGFVVR